MLKMDKYSVLVRQRREDTRWLVMYHKTVVGLAALAEMHAEACEVEWIAMQSALEDLAETMRADIDNRKEDEQ